MPQMMPMEWMMLYTFFLSTFLMFNILNYYMNTKTGEKKMKKIINQTSLNWKW
uniref:ATP synthase complex subunit 8 n=1 Tax=Dolichorhinotermes longilabius TaxID=280685 RepID=A0A0A7E7N1_9NEOP|nr:ATP synthase F0 subunit 8 [Dolichorhinotermes longilabius]